MKQRTPLAADWPPRALLSWRARTGSELTGHAGPTLYGSPLGCWGGRVCTAFLVQHGSACDVVRSARGCSGENADKLGRYVLTTEDRCMKVD